MNIKISDKAILCGCRLQSNESNFHYPLWPELWLDGLVRLEEIGRKKSLLDSGCGDKLMSYSQNNFIIKALKDKEKAKNTTRTADSVFPVADTV